MLGFVTGLRAEARLLDGVDCMVAVGGGTSAGAFSAARGLVARHVTGLISFGLAGGLDPALPRGAAIVPKAVTIDDRQYHCDAALIDFLGGATVARVTGATSIVASTEAKGALYRLTGAAAVDLESAEVAKVAREADLPFAVLRVLADPAWRELPPASLVALDSSGKLAFGALLRSVLDDPRQLQGLLRLAADAAAARRTLVRLVKLRLSG